jgi:hypothetical protein
MASNWAWTEAGKHIKITTRIAIKAGHGLSRAHANEYLLKLPRGFQVAEHGPRRAHA